MRIEIVIAKDGKVTAKAIDLTGDCWRDYLHYLDKARQKLVNDDILGMNRSLRSAFINLYAHLDGVVCSIHEHLQKTEKSFVSQKGNGHKKCTLYSKMMEIKHHAEKEKQSRLPYINLILKPLRDIIVHPSITKQCSIHKSVQKDILTEVDVFDLSIDLLTKQGEIIDRWLKKLCSLYSYPRKHDTKKICEKICNGLSGNLVSSVEF